MGATVSLFEPSGENAKDMPDVFLSYNRGDQATVRRFAEAFEDTKQALRAARVVKQ